MSRMDAISLNRKLYMMASNLNDIPLLCRVRPSDRANLSNILTKVLTPNILCMRKAEGFVSPND